jgi:dihydroneopterin aldolase
MKVAFSTGSDGMLTEIQLQNLEFFSYHGLYPGEKKEGNRFRVDVKISLDVPFQPTSEDLSSTIDYAQVYALVKSEMDLPCALLESLSQRIISRINAAFPRIIRLEVAISKANPAIGGLCDWVKVSSISGQS